MLTLGFLNSTTVGGGQAIRFMPLGRGRRA